MDPGVLEEAANRLRGARAVLITAGAGMGVDSGLPDFRGSTGFWRAYPAYQKLGLQFEELANPRWFAEDPTLAWGFYGHRLMLYRATVPHAGFAVLRRWAARPGRGAFVFTSNVDAQFQKAGFAAEHVHEVHGSIHHMQCLRGCGVGIVDATPWNVDVDPTTFRAREPLPRCPNCQALLRPNVLMFGDWGFDDARSALQEDRMRAWLSAVTPSDGLVVVELGAGTGVPTVRLFSEQVARQHKAALVRINVRESHGPAGTLGLALGAQEALTRLDALVTS